MYSIYTVIYGRVLTENEIEEIDKRLEKLGELIVQDWINEFGDSPYSGAGGPEPMYIGVPLGTITPGSHGKLLEEIRMTPTQDEIERVEEIRKEIDHIFKFEPRVYICHSTS